MCFPETKLGIFPGAGGTVLLPRLVGPQIAKDLIFTARRFQGAEAYGLGLLCKLVSTPEQVVSESMDFAQNIATSAPLGVAGTSCSMLTCYRSEEGDGRFIRDGYQPSHGFIEAV